jgi:hypothetical protein
MSFGLACSSLIAAIYLGEVSQSNSLAVTEALHSTFLTLGGITVLSALIFCKLQTDDGNSVSKGDVKNQLG